MDISMTTANEIAVVAFSGNLDTNSSPQAESAFGDLMKKGNKKILVDFRDLKYISSAGLRILLGAAKQLKTAGGELRLCNLNQTVREVFDISGFSTILRVFPDEKEALANF